MMDFHTLINENIFEPVIEYPILLVTVLASASIYFGYFYSYHLVKETSYMKRVFGFFYMIGYLGFFFYIGYLLVDMILPKSWLIIESHFWQISFILLVLIYAAIICVYITNKSQKFESAFLFEEVNPIYKYMPEIKRDILGYFKETMYNILASSEVKKIITFFLNELNVKISPLVLFIMGYILYYSNISIPTGIFLFSIIFIALTFVALFLGITKDAIRYANVYLKEPRLTISGRVKSIDENSIGILRRKKDADYTFYTHVPLHNIAKIELIKPEEVEDNEHEYTTLGSIS